MKALAVTIGVRSKQHHHNTIPKHHAHGFTLFETLIVIAILSVIAALAILTYRKKEVGFKVDKTAIEMQHVLEAAMAWHVDHSAWPDNNSGETCATAAPTAPTLTPFVSDYLPNANNQSSYGSYYCWQQTTSGNLFWVALQLPGADYLTAEQIAARLPNGVAIDDPLINDPTGHECTSEDDYCYVRAEVTAPQSGGGVSSDLVTAAGYCNPNSPDPAGHCTHTTGSSYTINFNCPASKTGEVILTPNFWEGGGNETQGYFTPYSASVNQQDRCTSDGPCSLTVTINGEVIGSSFAPEPITSVGGKIGATYIALCVSSTTH